MAIYTQFSHSTWSFSIVVLVYQRVCGCAHIPPKDHWKTVGVFETLEPGSDGLSLVSIFKVSVFFLADLGQGMKW